jgi:hypothetical protein
VAVPIALSRRERGGASSSRMMRSISAQTFVPQSRRVKWDSADQELV